MLVKKRIKIFTAFDSDVEEDIIRFSDFICGLNTSCPSIELFIFKSEEELCKSLEHPKEKIDGELENCEFFLLILGGKHNDYALGKLNSAIEQYAKTHGNPDIHIYVNMAREGAQEVRRFFSHDKKYEHYVEQFEHNDTLKAKFLTWLSAKQEDFKYEVDTDMHGTPIIKVGGRPVSGLVDFDALLNNEDYQYEKKKLNKYRLDYEENYKKVLQAEGKEKDILWGDRSLLAKKIKEQQDKVSEMEKNTLALYQN